MLNRRTFIAAGATAGATSFAGPLLAQSAQQINLILGFPAGGGPDTIARIVADHLRTQGQQVVIEQKTGAGGRIAMEFVKRAAPDGRTLVFTPGSMLSIYPHVYNKLTYSRDDFTPIAKVAAYPLALVVPAESPHKTLPEFLDWARKNPGKATCGLPGLGNDTNILSWKVGKHAGVSFENVPYQGGPQLTQGVLSNQVACAVNITSNFSELHRGGKIRILAVSSAKRSTRLPEVPTFVELGIKDAVSEESLGILGPKGMAPATVRSIAAMFLAAATDPAVQKLIQERDHIPQPENTEEFIRSMTLVYEQRGREVKAVGFQMLD